MLKLVAAYSLPTFSIGINGHLPWNYKEDKKVFKMCVAKCTLIGGAKTLQEVAFLKQPTIQVHSNTDWAELASLAKTGNYAIVGGQDVFAAGIKYCDFLQLTEIHKHYDGDRFFPHIPWEFLLTDVVPCESSPELVFTTWWRNKDGSI